MSNEKLSLGIIEFFGEEAKDAFFNGGTWDWSPDCAIDGMFIPDYCGGSDGCTRYWHEQWFITGYRIEDGVLYETIQSCDSDGNWEFEDECDVDDPELEEWRKHHSYEVACNIMQEYYEWVLEHGDDPLRQFFISHTYKQTHEVVVCFRDGKFFVDETKNLTKLAKKFLGLKNHLLQKLEWSSMDEFEEKVNCDVISRTGDQITIKFETDEPRRKRDVIAEIKERAKQSLKD